MTKKESNKSKPLDLSLRERLIAAIDKDGAEAVAKRASISSTTLGRALMGEPLFLGTRTLLEQAISDSTPVSQ